MKAITYHNMGNIQKNLKFKANESVNYHKKAFEILKRHYGEEYPLTRKFKKIY